jgi:hypothetical protein
MSDLGNKITTLLIEVSINNIIKVFPFEVPLEEAFEEGEVFCLKVNSINISRMKN